ncbi:MAG: 2-oxoglutarate dehydrogenase E1 component [Phycisphaerae bacterium]|nr:2-oxoglutarate dehydrogenase E1 component [Phycisphaerae bacterium]MCZ2401418.1 2-oxoglutarate dehydrogenase E1 component [Phycisphaerae bacterium]
MESLPSHQNAAFVEELLESYLQDPESVDDGWRRYFDQLTRKERGRLRARPRPSFKPASIFHGAAGGNGHSAIAAEEVRRQVKQDRLDQLVRAYRVRGHVMAQLDPLGMTSGSHPELDPAHYGFSESDLDQVFSCRTISGAPNRTLREIVALLQETYCRYIGVQFMHIDDLNVRHWLQERMEGTANRVKLSRREQFRILTRLTDAAIFETFIQKKFLGAKSFSLEGAESLIPLLDLAINTAGEQGIDEIVIGMAHRGRLNVLANIIGKSPREIFREFEDIDADRKLGRGDVKYHQGYHGEWTTPGGHKVYLALCFNPSHLEFVNPVALGRTRARQDRVGDGDGSRSMALLIHGDAAFAGEGIVQETLNLSELPAYRTGGSLHVIVNNQIGFTTTPQEGRSSLYCTDVAKMLQSPIFHVNGENPEAVAAVVQLAVEFRRQFHRDVIIDMYCYRRRGHNESDEPAFTQPVMYRAIRNRPGVREAYLEHLLELGGVTREEADEIADSLRKRLEAHLAQVRDEPRQREPASFLAKAWRGYVGGADASAPEVDTGVPRERLSALLEAQTRVPGWFRPHRTIQKLLEKRRAMAQGAELLDWGAAEALAFATLAVEGTRIRLTGQDSARGTFSHRHAVLHDEETGRTYMPLRHLADNQGPVDICNSPLSEAGVLGFEYGYSVAWPDGLVLWEAQFGDFVNTAQVIVDQFITSAEDKWHRLSGLVLLLPHGFEGEGPEHSSARLERFLNACAEDNIQVAYPTTPAQYYHLLRRQVRRTWRKPLVVMTPKSLLRQQVSSLDELASGRFQRVIDDAEIAPERVKRVLLCTGKIFFDLHQKRRELARDDVAIVRIEQLYPLSAEQLFAVLDRYPGQAPITWVQEEPENMGAWRYLERRFGDRFRQRGPLGSVCRPASASPATGSKGSHKIEQARLLSRAFGA